MSTILRVDTDGICNLTLNRPDKLNALDTETFACLDEHLSALEKERDAIGCVVLRGSGKGFCAGADLGGIASGTPAPPTFKPRVLERLALLPQPTIAAVHGVCYTGGLELALSCDFIIAEANARFADTHGKFGLVGAWGITQRLSRRVGLPMAKRMMMTAETITGEEASQNGLVDIVAESGKLDEVVAAFVAKILANSRFTNAAVKKLLIETDGMSLYEALAHEHYRHPGVAPDVRERIAAFASRKGA